MAERTEGHTPDKLYASVNDLDGHDDWPDVTPSEECCDELAGGAVVYVLETHEREAAPETARQRDMMFEVLKKTVHHSLRVRRKGQREAFELIAECEEKPNG